MLCNWSHAKKIAAKAKAQAQTRKCNKWNWGVQTVNKDKDGNEKYDKSNEIWSYEKLQAIEFVNMLVSVKYVHLYTYEMRKIVCCKRIRMCASVENVYIFHLTWQMVNKPSLWNETLMVPKTPLRQIIYTQHFVASKFFFLQPNRPQLSAFRTCKSLNTIPAENHEQAWAFLMVYNILCVQFHVSYQITADTHDVL